jgi:hypothetical protein
MLESESKKFVTSIGGKTANAYFEKKGSGYVVRTWGSNIETFRKTLISIVTG